MTYEWFMCAEVNLLDIQDFNNSKCSEIFLWCLEIVGEDNFKLENYVLKFRWSEDRNVFKLKYGL